ncbi:MAG: alpha-amylase family glycosyl hydrolase [Polyangia bacterium]|jgi:glycosidase|nr:alpha-amylase family glycosyl hydrolase [Polyangia bacterium]
MPSSRIASFLACVLICSSGCSDDDDPGNQNNLNNSNQNNTNYNGNSNQNNQNQGLPVRDCLYRVSLTNDSTSSIHVAGSFNGWDPSAWPLERVGNQWEIRLTTSATTAAGGARLVVPDEHEYKLVVDGVEWWLDPGNPLTRFDAAQANENSLLIAEDCSLPAVELVEASVDYSSGGMSLRLQVRDGAEAQGLSSVTVREGGQTLGTGEVSADLDTGVVQIQRTSLPRGKYTHEITAVTNGGREAVFRAPVWMEPEWRSWQDLVVYNIMVDRFANGDPANDAPAGVEALIDWHGGDFAGILQKLQEGFFDDLGITALWLSTPNDNPDTTHPGDCGRSFSAYHTYWVQSSREVENHFGTADDLKALVEEAHSRGMRVMVDWAANHVFVDHPLYRAHEGDPLWFNYPATSDPANLWQNKCGVLPDGWNTYAQECWFTEYLPDFNHKNHELIRLLTEDALWWVREFDLDGFRVDATKHIRSNYLRYLRHRLDREVATWYTPFYMVGENFIYDYGLIARNISPAELHGQFDFPLYGTVRWAFGEATAHMDDLNGFVYQNFIDNQAIPDLSWASTGYVSTDTLLGIFLGNHDVSRFSSVMAGQEDGSDFVCQVFNSGSPPQPEDDSIYHRMRLAFAFLFTVRGLPVVYYGDEIGLAGVHDPDNRRPMSFDLGSLSSARALLRSTVARLGKLRGEHAALRTGRYDAFAGYPGCMAYAKADASETAIVVLAAEGGCTLELAIKGGFGIVDGDTLVDRLPESGGQAYTVSGMSIPLDLAPYTAQILFRQ